MKPPFCLQLEKRAESAGWSSPKRTGTGTHLNTSWRFKTKAKHVQINLWSIYLTKDVILCWIKRTVVCETFSLFHLYLLLLILAASSSTRDCLQLLKLIGVPVIQVWPTICVICALFCFKCRFISLFYALGSRGRRGTVCLAGERGNCRCCGIRGHGHSAIWSQYSHSPT